MSDASLEAVNKLRSLSELVGIKVSAKVPTLYLEDLRKISRVPIEYSDADWLEYPSNVGPITVRRQMSHSRLENGSYEARP